MNLRTLDLIESLHGHEGTEQWWDACMKTLEHQGVESLCYGMIPFTNTLSMETLADSAMIRSTHPREWNEFMQAHGMLKDELTAELAIGGAASVIWHDESLWDRASPEHRRVNELEKDLGMGVGTTLALSHSVHGVLASGIGLCTPGVWPEEFDRYWNSSAAAILSIVSVLDDGLVGSHAEALVKLLPEERDALTLLAAGFRPDEIARRLRRSPGTVDEIVERAKVRLSARTRDHAVAKAVRLRLIDP